jgi:hypothetical protein
VDPQAWQSNAAASAAIIKVRFILCILPQPGIAAAISEAVAHAFIRSANCDIIRALFEIVNAASKRASGMTRHVCCTASQTGRRQMQNPLRAPE